MRNALLPMVCLLALSPRTHAADPPSSSPTSTMPNSAALIRTPPPPATPRINGTRAVGARPTHPFLFHLPVTGERPVTYVASGLPAGLTLDPQTGNVTGSVATPGRYPVIFTATNARGKAEATVEIIIGDTICLTPPMGYNSWNHFARNVSDENMRAAADAMVSSGLIDHGWTYVNIDDCWQSKERDAQGEISGNGKFPDLKALADYIHSKGLKFGIYSSPGPKTCGGFLGSYQHEDQDAASYAKWEVDYVKYDLCSYGKVNIPEHMEQRVSALLPPERRERYVAVARESQQLSLNHKRNPEQEARFQEVARELKQITAPFADQIKAINREEEQTPYQVFGKSLAKVPRDIVYSLCQYGNANSPSWAPGVGGNCWRTTGDIRATWKSMSGIGFGQAGLSKYASPGHWNDPDMLEIGNRASAHGSSDQELTPDENYTHMTLWCMLSAPLLIGCDMSRMDPLTISIFSNDEVIAVNQDVLGKQGDRLKQEGPKGAGQEVWVKPLADGTMAVAFFNRGENQSPMSVTWSELKFPGAQPVRDLWRQTDLADNADGITMTVASHGAELVKVGRPRVNENNSAMR